MSATPESEERFVPEDRVYRIFYEEVNKEGAVELRNLIGRPIVFRSGEVLVRRKGRPDVVLRNYLKMEVCEPGPNDGGRPE